MAIQEIVPPGTLLYGIFSLVLYAADSKEEVEAFKTYLYTKEVRFLLLQCVVSQDITREKISFLYRLWIDMKVYIRMKCSVKKWNISPEEWSFIDSKNN